MTTQEFESLREKFCDNYCKYPYICETEEEIDGICDKCPLNELAEIFGK